MLIRGRSLIPALAKMKWFVTIFNYFQRLTTVTARAQSQIWRWFKIDLCSNHWKFGYIMCVFYSLVNKETKQKQKLIKSKRVTISHVTEMKSAFQVSNVCGMTLLHIFPEYCTSRIGSYATSNFNTTEQMDNRKETHMT